MVRFRVAKDDAATKRGMVRIMAPSVYAFEAIDETLPLVPLAARRVLDSLGKKLSVEGWLSLPLDVRRAVVRAGSADRVEPGIQGLLGRAQPGALAADPTADPDPSVPPRELVSALGEARPLAPFLWTSLRPLDRYGLVQCAKRHEKLFEAYDEIVGAASLSHLKGDGQAHMVDVGPKASTARRAIASARVLTTTAVLRLVFEGGLPKGDVLAVARVAGLLAAKRTAELIPLCHPVQTTAASIEFVQHASAEIRIVATVEAVDRTGVEMEAMVAASVAALTVYDMIKSADRWARIDSVQLDEKHGGKSGVVRRPPARSPS